MSKSINSVQLLGRLGRDAETRHTPTGNAVTNFSMATDHRYKKDGEWKTATDWHDVQMWGGENVAPYLLKGTQVHVSGRLQTRSWEANDGTKKYKTEVVAQASDVILLGGDSPREGSSSPSPSRGPDEIADDKLPF